MRIWRRTAAIVREATSASLSSPIASIATTILVASLCATVLLTTGRTVGTEQAVLGSIDAAGTRTIVVRADPAAGLKSSVLDRLSSIDGIQWAGAFGQAIDVTNTHVADGDRVAARLAYGSRLNKIGIPGKVPFPGETAWGTTAALADLGLPDRAGSVTTLSGADYTVAGRIHLPDWLSFLGPTLVVPQPPGPPAPVSIVVIVANRPDLVAPLASAVQSILGVDDPTKVTITTSEALAQLRALVQGQLGSFGRGLVLLVLAVSAILVASILTGLVTLRRKDFGRRRALGATRGLIIVLVLTQTAGLALNGVIIGSGIATVVLVAGRDPLPGVAFTGAIAVLAMAVSLTAALVPAIIASRRDPITELRVP